MHRLLPARGGRRRKAGIAERADRDAAIPRIAVAFPIQAGAAIRTEVKADLGTAIGHAGVDLLLALDTHAVLRVGRAGMHQGTGAPLTGYAVADINPVRLARSDRLK